MVCSLAVNPLEPGILNIGRLTKILISIQEGILKKKKKKKYPMSVAPMSLYTKRTYLRLCHE